MPNWCDNRLTFKHVSCAFSFITDDEKLIAEFEDLFKKNKKIEREESE